MEVAPFVKIRDPQPLQGWRIIKALFQYCSAIDIDKFDPTHRYACLLKGIRRKFQRVRQFVARPFIPFAGRGRRLDAIPEEEQSCPSKKRR